MNKLTKTQFDLIRKKLKKDGKLTTTGVLQLASNPDSPLHGLFQWDDTKAADEYRKMQARSVIKRYNVSIEDAGEQVVHVRSVKKGEGEYKETETVVLNISDFEMAMDEATSKLRSAEKAVAHLQEIAHKESPDTTGILAVAMQGLNTANLALDKIH